MLETDETAQARLFSIQLLGGEWYSLITSELINQNTYKAPIVRMCGV